MKRRTSHACLIMTILTVLFSLNAYAAEPTNTSRYTDAETQATFTVPTNWVESPLSQPRDFIDVKFTSNEEPGMVIMYGSYDVWGALSVTDQENGSRADLDSDNYTKDEMAELFGISSEDMSAVTYSGTEYYKMTTTTTDTEFGTGMTITMTQIFMLDNGYMHLFQFSGTSDDVLYGDFEALLNSVSYKNSKAISSNKESNDIEIDLPSKFSFADIFFSLIMTVAIYSLPIIIYRYSIKKEPVEKQKAKKITIIYGASAFVVMSILIFSINGSGTSSGAILLWSFINYRMLIGGKKQSAADNTGTHMGPECALKTASYEPQPLNPPEIRFCHKCGAKLQPDSLFCDKCGQQIVTKSEG